MAAAATFSRSYPAVGVIAVIKRVGSLGLYCSLLAATVPATLAAESERVFSSNYHLVLNAGESMGEIQTSARVRDGHTIPAEFQTHRIDITVTSVSDSRFVIRLNIFEKYQSEWYRLDAGEMEFEGEFGIPVEYAWNSADLQLNLAIVVSPEPH